MKKIKAIIGILIAVPALMIFAGEASVEMLPLQLMAGAVLMVVAGINGAFRKESF